MQQNFCPDQNEVSSVLHYDVEPAIGFPRNVVFDFIGSVRMDSEP